jgi:hypothetical protein
MNNDFNNSGEMDTNSIGLALISTAGYIISMLTLSQVAMWATILAALSTFAYNIWKIIKNK